MLSVEWNEEVLPQGTNIRDSIHLAVDVVSYHKTLSIINKVLCFNFGTKIRKNILIPKFILIFGIRGKKGFIVCFWYLKSCGSIFEVQPF